MQLHFPGSVAGQALCLAFFVSFSAQLAGYTHAFADARFNLQLGSNCTCPMSHHLESHPVTGYCVEPLPVVFHLKMHHPVSPGEVNCHAAGSSMLHGVVDCFLRNLIKMSSSFFVFQQYRFPTVKTAFQLA